MSTAPPQRRTGALAVVVALVALAFVIGMMPGGGAAPPHSSFRREPDGRLFAYLLLEELGFRPRAWRGPPGDLPRARTLLWLPAAPPEPPAYLRDLWKAAEESPEDEVAARRSTGRMRDPRHYRRFLEEGGVMLTALGDERREFLVDELDLEAVSDLELVRAGDGSDRANGRPRRGRQRVAALGGEVLELERAPRTSGGRVEHVEWIADPLGRATPLIADPDRPERAVAWSLSVGRGELVVIAADVLFENDGIPLGDNALVLVRLLEAFAPIDAVLFDESALGETVHRSPLDLAFARGNLALTLQLGAALALLVWMLARARAFPRDPQDLDAASPLARARALGATLARLGRHDVLADMLRRGVIARLPGGRAGPLDAGEDAARRALAGVAHAARDDAERKRWERAVRAASVRSAQELEAYALELAPLERLASRGTARHNPRRMEATR